MTAEAHCLKEKDTDQWRKQRRGKKREQPVLQNSSDWNINLYTEAGKSVQGRFSFCSPVFVLVLHKYTRRSTVRRSRLIGKRWSCKKWRCWTLKHSSAFISRSFTASPPVHLTFLLHLRGGKKKEAISENILQSGRDDSEFDRLHSKRVTGDFKRLCGWFSHFTLNRLQRFFSLVPFVPLHTLGTRQRVSHEGWRWQRAKENIMTASSIRGVGSQLARTLTCSHNIATISFNKKKGFNNPLKAAERRRETSAHVATADALLQTPADCLQLHWLTGRCWLLFTSLHGNR